MFQYCAVGVAHLAKAMSYTSLSCAINCVFGVPLCPRIEAGAPRAKRRGNGSLSYYKANCIRASPNTPNTPNTNATKVGTKLIHETCDTD